MRTVELSTTLAAPADTIWRALTADSAAFRFVTRGLIRFPAARAWDRPIQPGDELSGWVFLFGFIPFSRHTIAVAEVDGHARRLVTEEGGGAIRTWRHTISVTPVDDTACRYTDRIDLDAGALTPAVEAYARGFYRVRQRRWRVLAELLAAAGGPPERST